ncbi:PREDICTED: poly [ADP-ribose] polymerase 14-like isoform X2 [Branchiostoma belcheri]|uniref:Poly [ADP-ribose] polymerase n=1 Tax=Branchiostoma belcheri TaxID=7741 RepID=A0A6P5ASL3_BRABE|nr:PREDICTED: poly [ADP-ribose] polymerase 14-like isoform X2 [Branchiostoma belcheri]
MPPIYPYPAGYGPPTYPSFHGHQQIPGQPSMNIQEDDSAHHPPHPPPPYDTVYPGDTTPSKELQTSETTDSEDRSQPQENLSASPAPSEEVTYPNNPPQSPYPFPHGESHPQAQIPQPAEVQYPHPAIKRDFPSQQASGSGQMPTYPEYMTTSKEKKPHGTDSEDRSQPQEDSSASTAQAQLGDQTQPPPDVPNPNSSSHGPYPHLQAPGPGQLPTYPGHMTTPKEKQPSGTDNEGRPQPQEHSSASAAPSSGTGFFYPGPPYQFLAPQGQNQPPNSVYQYRFPPPQASGPRQPPGFHPRHPYVYRYPGYPYPSMHSYMPPPPPHQWPYPYPWLDHGQYPGQHVPATEPPQGGEESTMPPMDQQEEMDTEEETLLKHDSTEMSPVDVEEEQEGIIGDHESPIPVPQTEEGQLYMKPNEEDRPGVPQESEEENTDDPDEQNKTVAVEVTGLTGDEFEERKDVLRLYFENTKRSGGGDISQFDIDSEKERILITFKDKEVPGRVVQKSTHDVGKRKLKVRIVKPRPELPVDSTRILLRGLVDKVEEETLLLYLESMSKFQDEPFEVFCGKDPGTVMVTFTEPISDLDSLLARCEGRELEQQTISAEKVHVTDCIQVTEIPPKTSEDNLRYYFDNTKRSGGGSVADVQLDKDRGTALVSFDDHTVIERVLNKNHKIQKTKVTVEPFYTCLGATIPIASFEMACEQLKKAHENPRPVPPQQMRLHMPREGEETMRDDQAEEEDKTVAVEVTGLTGDELEKMQDVLRYYFENTKRSGGGDISQFDMDTEKGHLLITFEDMEAPGRVMQKSPHEVGRKKLKVRTVKPRPELPVDPTRILLKGVVDTVTEETLFLFLEAMSRGQNEPSEIFYGKDVGTVMVSFTEPISTLDTLLARCEGRELEQQTISADKVRATNCIQVTGIPPKASKDNLYYYFENTRRSGGGPVAEVELDKDQGTALVLFDDHNVIERVLKQAHTIQKKKVNVEPFYTCLGATVTEAKTPPQLVPLPITVNVTHLIASFVMTHGQFKQALDDAMEEVYSFITWPVGGDQSCMEIAPTLTKKSPNLAGIAENWASNARDGLKNFLARFDTKEIADVMQASWPQVCKLIDDDTLKDDDKISVRSTSDRKVTFIGLKDSVAKHYQIVMEGKRKIEGDIKRKQSEVDETVSTLKAEQVRLLTMSNFKERMTSKFPKLQMSFDTNGSKVKFHGLLDEIQQTKMSMYETVQGVISQRVKLSPTLISFLANAKEPKQHLLGEYKRASVVAVITTTAGEVQVYGLSDGDVKKAISILNNTFQEQRLDVPHQSTPVLRSEEWKTTKTALEQSAQGLLKISVESNADSGATKILFTGASAFVKDIKDRVETYLRVKTIYEQQVEVDDGKIRFIKEHQAANLQVQLETHQVSLLFDGSEESPTMSIKGNSDGIQKADPILKSYIESVISDQMSIKKPGMSKHFREDSGRSTLQHVERKCKCVINIQDAMNKTPAPDPDTFAKQFMPTSPTLVPMEKAVVNLDDGKKLVVWGDDITKHKADVIVNAANARLEHTGGLAKAIVDAGGDIIQQFCNNYIRANGTLIPGQVVASPPGRINTCQQILHAVGPIWQGGGNGEEDDLADAVDGSLDEAAKNNYRSIAIPAISSGIYGYPLKKCAETIVATTVEYLDDNPDTTLEVIEFVNIDDQTAGAFVDALVAAFGDDRVKKSDRQVGQATTRKQPRKNRRGRGSQPGGPSTTTPLVFPRQTRDPVADVGFRTTEGKAIIAIQANIASQNVDVLVNTTAGNLDLNTGAVSRAILQLAGTNLQALVNRAKQRARITSLPDGQILVTDSADLSCKQVIHCVLCSWDGGQGNSEKVLRKIVRQCLQQAEKGNYSSIAIPAMGTGGLRFPHDVVAEAMFDEAVNYCRKHPSGSLREIRFIVWEGDPKSIPAFNEVMSKYKAMHTSGAPQSAPTSGAAAPHTVGGAGRGRSRRGAKKGGGRQAAGPTDSPDSTTPYQPGGATSAVRSLFSAVSNPVRGELQMFVGDLTLNVRKGDLTMETTDCIVNSSNEQLDLTRGAVSNAICKAGGPTIARECTRIAASGGMKGGIAVTGAGKLKSNKIIHAAAPAKATDWKTVIINCLQTADSLGLRSIAFPALGTGILQGSAAQTATTMLDALQDFVLQYKPTKLNEVRVTIFQQEMVRTFHEEMRKMVGQPLPKTKAAKASGIFGSIGRAAAAGWSYLTGGQTTNTDNPPIPSADNVVVLVIYADRADNIVEAKAMISKIMDDASKDERIPLRIKLTEELKDHVKGIAQRHDCSVTFTRSIIRVQGRLIDVMETSRDIMEFQRDVETKTNEEKHLSDKAELLLKTVQWYYIVEERQPYDSKVNYILEKAYLANETGVDFQFDGEDLHIDLTTMKETVVGDRSAVAIDVIRLEKEKEGNIKIPETWTVVSEEDPSKAVELQPSTDEYKKVHDEFMKSIATAAPTAGYSAITSAKVLKIQRIENAALWKQYMVRKKKMELDNAKSSQPVERILYHGTPVDPISSINRTGFNRSFSGRNVGAVLGNGPYFAVTASISGADQYARQDSNGHRYMYMARVLSGDMCKGQRNIIVPPAKDSTKPHITYDSVCDNATTPQIIVIFYDSQAYPEYLITFTK